MSPSPTPHRAGRRRVVALVVGLVALAIAGGTVLALSAFGDQRALSPPPPLPSTTTIAPAETEIVMVALGTTGSEQLEVWVGTRRVGQVQVGQEVSTSTFTTTAAGDVEVRFVNDGATELGNRDVVVDHVIIGGQRFESESPDTVAVGHWDPVTERCRAEPAAAQVDALSCDGFFRYATIDAAGDVVPLAPLPDVSTDSLPVDAVFVAVDGDDQGPGTRDEPWRTIQHAVDRAVPGTVIVVRAGGYDESVVIEQSGAQDAPIELRAHPGERPVLRAVDGPGVHVQTPAAPIPSLSPAERSAAEPVGHIVISGFELAGEGNTSSNGWASGVTVDYAHDVRVLDNVIHGFPGGGVSSNQSDNILVAGNRIDAVGDRGLTQYSGLSAYQPVNRGGPDIEPGFRMVFRDNQVSGVRTLVTTAGKQFGPDYRSAADPADVADDQGTDGVYSDANCVIVDDGRQTQNDSPFEPYDGWTLIEGNTCTDNMGRGIHVFHSDRVLARDNQLRRNLAANRDIPPPPPFGFDPWGDFRWTGELNASRSSDVRFEDNVVEASGGFDRNSWESSDIVFSGNTYVGAGIETSFTDGATFVDEAASESAPPD